MSADPETVSQYLERPYPISLVPQETEDGKPIWFAEVEDLPGCMSRGPTPEDAVARARDAMGAWITVALERGQEIPAPRSVHEYSGRFLVRMPRSLHGRLASDAQKDNVSLNLFVTNALAAAVGWRVAPAPQDEPEAVQQREVQRSRRRLSYGAT